MAAQIQIELLGEFHITSGGEALPGIDTPRLRSLLAYLVLHQGKSLQRARIAFLFWPESTEKQALTNLRHQLHKLRHALPDDEAFLKVETKSLTWLSGAPSTLDIDVFRKHLCAADEAAQKGEGKLGQQALVRAVESYTGELMPGVYEQWVEDERDDLAQAYAGALAKLIALHEDLREYGAATGFAKKLRLHEPTRESTYGKLIRLALLSGDRAAAMHFYHDCESTLKRELGIGPGATLRAIHERLLAGEELELPKGDADADAGQDTPELALQGRHAEWAKLKNCWSEASKGTAQLVVLTGDPGIGKTRLAEELLAWVTSQGTSAARTRSYAAEGRLAYAPAVDWLSAAPLRRCLEKLDDVWIAEIMRIFPDLRAERPDLESASPIADQAQRHQLFEALSRAVLAGGDPLLLLLDDVQWTDQETLEWLRFLLRFAPAAPLLLVGTVRVEEMITGSPVERLLLDLRRDGVVTEIPVGPMEAAEAALVAEGVAGRSLTETEVAQLHSETEGNPLFIVESVRAGLQVDRRGPVASPSGGSLPPKVHAVISARFGQLSKTARELVSVGAVIGREFTFELLIEVCSQSEDELADALEELWQRRIVRERGGAGHYDFAHDKLREVAYETVSVVRRRLLHRRVGEALEALHATHLDPISTQLAFHFEEAGCLERAMRASTRAAEAAKGVFAADEAMRLFNKAIELLAGTADLPDSVEIELGLQTSLGACIVAAEGYQAANVLETYGRADALCQQLARPTNGPILRGLALHALTVGQFERSRQLGDEILALYESDGDHLLLVEGHYVLGVSYFWLGDFPPSRHHLGLVLEKYDPAERALHLANYAQDPYAICLCRLAWTELYLGFPERWAETIGRCFEYVGQYPDPHSEGYVRFFSAQMALELRNIDWAAEQLDTGRQVIEKYRLGFWMPRTMLIQGMILVENGEVSEGLAKMEEAVADIDLDNFVGSSQFQLGLGAAYLKSGDIDRARHTLRGAFAYVEKSGERHIEAELHRLEGLVALEDPGEALSAEKHFQKALDIARARSAPFQQIRAAIDLGDLWVGKGEKKQAREQLQSIYQQFTEGFTCADLVDARVKLEEWS